MQIQEDSRVERKALMKIDSHIYVKACASLNPCEYASTLKPTNNSAIYIESLHRYQEKW